MKTGKVKRESNMVTQQISDAWTKCVYHNREHRGVRVGTAEYVEEMDVEIQQPWPEFCEAICEVQSLPQIPPIIPGFSNPSYNTRTALMIVRNHLLTKAYYQSLACVAPQVIVGLATDNRKKTGTTVYVEAQGKNKKNSNARRLVWVIRRDVLNHAMESDRMDNLISFGAFRYLQSVNNMGTTYQLKPPLRLPSMSSFEEADFTGIDLSLIHI